MKDKVKYSIIGLVFLFLFVILKNFLYLSTKCDKCNFFCYNVPIFGF